MADKASAAVGASLEGVSAAVGSATAAVYGALPAPAQVRGTGGQEGRREGGDEEETKRREGSSRGGGIDQGTAGVNSEGVPGISPP